MVMPSKAKRRRELAGLGIASDTFGSSSASSSSSSSLSPPGVGVSSSQRYSQRRSLSQGGEDYLGSSSSAYTPSAPLPPGAHVINGRQIVGDKFILHCSEGVVVSGPGWWEDLDAGASDTYVSPCSFEAAVAAAAVVCAGVDAVAMGAVTGNDLQPTNDTKMSSDDAMDTSTKATSHDTSAVPREAPEEGNEQSEMDAKAMPSSSSSSSSSVSATLAVSSLSTTDVITSDMLLSLAGKTTDADTATLTEVTGVKNVFCCVRPPGHHAGRFGSTRGCSNNGFCLLNNVAVGAYYARIKYGLRRVAVVDIDAHFGNGTAEIFEGDPHAFYSSVHLQYDGPKDYFFPSSQCCILGAEERHPNRVLVNVYPPVRAGNPLSRQGKPRGRTGFRSSFEEILIPALRDFRPDIIFISAG